MGSDQPGLLDEEGRGQIYTIRGSSEICSDHTDDFAIYAHLLLDVAALCGKQNSKLSLVIELGFLKENDQIYQNP